MAEACAAEIAADRVIEVFSLPREEAFSAHPDLIRTATNLLPPELEVVRIVDIVGLDTQADGGTHVASTRVRSGASRWSRSRTKVFRAAADQLV